MAERNTIPFHVQIDLPAQISVDETDFCLVLSNLLENALEASLKTAKFRQRIDIKIYRHASNLILIQIENAFDGKIQQNHGIFLSSKRNQNGIGIQSVRHIVEKTGVDVISRTIMEYLQLKLCFVLVSIHKIYKKKWPELQNYNHFFFILFFFLLVISYAVRNLFFIFNLE